MIEHTEIALAIANIREHHVALLDLMARAEDRAKAIGQILLRLLPLLKEANSNISELCEDLPFGKTAAYEYIAIAKGNTSWDELNSRKNANHNSATAEKERVAREIVVPEYEIEVTMGAIAGMAWRYSISYKGTAEEAADALIQELLKEQDLDGIGLSIARDRMLWVLTFKEALDLAEQQIREFLSAKPNLQIVTA